MEVFVKFEPFLFYIGLAVCWSYSQPIIEQTINTSKVIFLLMLRETGILFRFVDGHTDKAEDVTMATWACLFQDGQAMDTDDQVSSSSMPAMVVVKVSDPSINLTSFPSYMFAL